LGALCLYALTDILDSAGAIIARPFSWLDELVIMIAIALCTFNYAVNIGFTRSWGWWPLLTVLAALFATPGCEMRSIPEAVRRITGKPVQEHTCPIWFIAKIDDWERQLRNP